MQITYWAERKWWLAEEYSRVWTYHGITQPDVEDRFNRVMETFDVDWQNSNASHPVFQVLFTQGLVPFQYLFNLGGNLRDVANCLRVKQVLQDLRVPTNYESALFELEIAAYLKRRGHEIEFRPPLDNGKKADFSAIHSGQKTFFEIKRMQSSNRQRSMDALGQQVSFTVSALESDSQFAGKSFYVELDPSVADLLNGEPDADMRTIVSIANSIQREIVRRAAVQESFDISGLARVTVVTDRMKSGVNWPMVSYHEELRRFLRAHLQHAITQLDTENPGIILVQTPGLLDQALTVTIVDGWLKQSKAMHVSAIIFLPVYNSMPRTWAFFKPFAVVNDEAKFPANDVRAFVDLLALVEQEVAIPTAEEST